MKYPKDNSCGYSKEWQPYKMEYDKFEYDIKLKDGRIIQNCYPNAGWFNSIDPKYKNGASGKFSEKDVSEIRFTPIENWKYGINYEEMYKL